MNIEVYVVAHGNQTNGFREFISVDPENTNLNVLRMKVATLLYEKIEGELYNERYRMFKMFKLISTENGFQAHLMVNDDDTNGCNEIHVLPSGGPGGINQMVPEQIPQRTGWFGRKWQFASSRIRTESLEKWFADEAPVLSIVGFFAERSNIGTQFITCWHCDTVHNCWANKNVSSIIRSHMYFKPKCPLNKRQEALDNIRRCEETIRVGSHLNNTIQMILLNKNLCLEKDFRKQLVKAENSLMEMEDDDVTGIRCGICLEPKASIVNLPCRHESTCLQCYRRLRDNTQEQRKCTICNVDVQFAFKSFRDHM